MQIRFHNLTRAVWPGTADHRLWTLVAVACLALSPTIHAAEPAYDYHVKLTPENSAIGNFPAQKAPILTVKSGQTVRIDTGGGNRWGDKTPDEWFKEANVPASGSDPVIQEIVKVLKDTTRYGEIKNGHLLVGPIAVENAMPGDTLEVDILSVQPRIPYGTVGTRPGSGGIPDDPPGPYTHVVKFDFKRNVGIYDTGIEVPLAPFMGVMGTLPAPELGPNVRSGPPGKFGGNLDCKELVAGTKLFLPVFNRGAMFYTGDAHAAQGDGEVTVNAIETANTAILRFVLHKGKKLDAPRAETSAHYMAFGLDPDLDTAMQMAIRQTNSFIGELYGLDFNHAFTLSSIAVDFRVTQVVDQTKGIHSMIPKAIFKKPAADWLK